MSPPRAAWTRSSRRTTCVARCPISSTPTCAAPSAAPWPASPARPRSWWPATCARAAWSWRPPSPTACGPRASTSSTSAWPPPTSCTSRRAISIRPAPCSRRRTTRRSTTGSSSACPGRGRSGATPAWPTLQAGAEELLGQPLPPLKGGWTEQNLLDEWADHVRVLRRRQLAAPAQGRGRHRQRHGRAGRADRVRAAALHGRHPLPRARRQLPEPPGRSDPAREPRRPEGGRPRARRRHRAGLRRRRGPCLPGRREGRAGVGLADHGAGRRVHAGQAPRARRSSTTSSVPTWCPRS